MDNNRGLSLGLPFLKRKQESGGSTSEPIVRKHDDGESYDPMESVAQDMMTAFNADDHRALARALRAAFDLADSESHEEGTHVE